MSAEKAHVLEEGTLEELLRSVAIEGRSGAITIATPKGYGEICLVDGDVVDAVYVRLEGLKALVRLFGEREGTASFSTAAPAMIRRLNVATASLIDEARAQAKRAEAMRDRVASLASGLIVAIEKAAVPGLEPLDERVLARLRAPTELDVLLDDLREPDADILEALVRLEEHLRSVGRSATVQLCGPDQLHMVRSSAERAKGAGFQGAARLVFAATAGKLAVLGHTVLALADAQAPTDPAPSLAIPHPIATLSLGEGIDLDVVALPLVPAYAPLWPMVLAGAAVTIRVDEAASQALEEACAAVGVTILDASAVFGVFDESSPMQVASLIRTALEAESQN